MKFLYILLRALGFLFFLLLAIGYYEKELILNGVWAAIVGGLVVSPANRYPKGLKGKTLLVLLGLIIVVCLEAFS